MNTDKPKTYHPEPVEGRQEKMNHKLTRAHDIRLDGKSQPNSDASTLNRPLPGTICARHDAEELLYYMDLTKKDVLFCTVGP